MPEGPEVKIITQVLKKDLKNKVIKNISFLGGRYVKHSPPKNYKQFAKELPQRVANVNCKGKFIYITFKNGYSIWITLGMTGFFTYKNYKHNDILIKYNNKKLYFNDYRHFGTFTFCLSEECLSKKLKTLGPDILSIEFTLKLFNEIIQKTKKTTILAVFLMNQKKISGVGNYLRSEILYDSKINPFIKIGMMSQNQIKKLFKSIVKISKKSFNSQNVALKDEKNYTDEFIFKVYQQDKTPKGEKVHRKLIKGRSVFYVK